MVAAQFREKVLEVVKKIPKGSVLSYGEVAKRAGSPLAFRAVGSIMAKNRDTHIPCHRVIQSNGMIGAYNDLLGKSKKEILLGEGVMFDKNNKVVV